MINQEEIQKMHCGLWRTPLLDAAKVMPQIKDILFSLKDISEFPLSDYVVDAKIHMLMPKQYPCIPNWHYDMVPRDSNNKQDFSRVSNDLMYLWVSNAPVTEFKYSSDYTDSYGLIKTQTWIPFGQKELHRGTQSNSHIWRLFIRACPTSILKPNPEEKWIRRHSQVYLDPNSFTW
jgi:hypothetical protein